MIDSIGADVDNIHKEYKCPKHGNIKDTTISLTISIERFKHLEGFFCTACLFEWFNNNISKVIEKKAKKIYEDQDSIYSVGCGNDQDILKAAKGIAEQHIHTLKVKNPTAKYSVKSAKKDNGYGYIVWVARS